MHIFIPRQFSAQDLFQKTGVCFVQPSDLPSEITFDFSKLGFARPTGVVFLNNLTRYLLSQDVVVKYAGMNVESPAIRYLDDSLFFEPLLGQKLNPQSQPRGTTIPLTEVTTLQYTGWLSFTLVPWLVECTGYPEEVFAELRTCLAEVFNNIKDHTTNGVASVFCQWFPKEKSLRIALADFGVGVPATVSRVAAGLSDNDAILKAFEEGFSSQSIPTNRGIGLHFLKQNVVENLHGRLTLRSQSGAICFDPNGNETVFVPNYVQGYCPGTMIELEIPTEKFDLEPQEAVNLSWI
ncbi:MAG: hypothetical protein ACJAYH_001433 [Celeribacter sp.]|jgi:hypothetical protein